MVRLTQRGLVSGIGAIAGFLSLLLPWVVFSASAGGTSATEGLSPVQFIAQAFGPSSSGPTDPAIVAWQERAVLGSWLWLIGTIALGIGCLLSILQPFIHSRVGGIVMLVGSGMGGAGIGSFSASFPTSSGVQLTIGPTYGIAVALVGCFVALLSFFVRDIPITQPPGLFSASAYPSQAVYPYQAANQEWRPTQTAEMGPLATQSTPALTRFCPTCGQWYQQEYKLCPRDGTELRPVQ